MLKFYLYWNFPKDSSSYCQLINLFHTLTGPENEEMLVNVNWLVTGVVLITSLLILEEKSLGWLDVIARCHCLERRP